MKHYDLNAPPSQTMAEIVRTLKERAQSSKTGAAGVKDLGEKGDVVWDGTDSDGQPAQKSVKRFSVELDDTTARAEELAEKVADAEQEIADATGRLGDAEDLLDEVDARPYPTRTPVPPRSAPVGTQWLTPTDHLYVRIPCEEVPDGV